jgi:hypothetical protein
VGAVSSTNTDTWSSVSKRHDVDIKVTGDVEAPPFRKRWFTYGEPPDQRVCALEASRPQPALDPASVSTSVWPVRQRAGPLPRRLPLAADCEERRRFRGCVFQPVERPDRSVGVLDLSGPADARW